MSLARLLPLLPLLLGLPPVTTCAEGPRSGSQSWTVETEDTRLTLGIDTNGGFCCFNLSNPRAAWNWVGHGSSLPLMSRAGSSSAPPLRWSFAGAATDRALGSSVTFRFTNAEPRLELHSTWHALPGPGPVRHTMTIRNLSPETVTFSPQDTLDFTLAAPATRITLCYFNDDGSLPDKVGVYREMPVSGAARTLRISEEQDFIPFVYVDAGGAHGLYAGWEWSIGRVAMTGLPGGVRLQFGSGDEFRTAVAPGATFEVPPGFIGTYSGDIDDGGNRLRKYLFAHSMPACLRQDTSFPKAQWNAFAPLGNGQGSWVPLESKYRPFIDGIVPLGFEEVVIDVGWWSSYGDPGHIVAHPTHWPGGMAAAAEYAHARNLRFGLYDNEPEDLTTLEGIRERIRDIAYLFHEFNVDFYRSDSTAGPVLKGSHGAGGRSSYPEDVGYWATKGFYEVMDTLAKHTPSFMWECCSGGGRIKDFGVSRRAVRIQNQDRYYPLDARQSFHDTSHCMHPIQIAALDGSWAEWQATGSVYEFRSASMGAAYWHPDAPNGGNGGPVWSADQKAQIARAVHTYKTKIRPLIREGDLYHILPRPDDVLWDGIEYFHSQAQRGVMYLFKPKSPSDYQSIRLRGLNSDLRYRITFEDGTNPNITASGEALMRVGLPVTLRGTYVSELVFFEKE